MKSFPVAVRSLPQNERASFRVASDVSATSKCYAGINRRRTRKSSLKLGSLVTTIRWPCKEPFGGYFLCILTFEPEMRPESCAGGMCCWKRIPKQAENFSFGGRRNDRKLGKRAQKLATKDLSVRNCSLLVVPDAQ